LHCAVGHDERTNAGLQPVLGLLRRSGGLMSRPQIVVCVKVPSNFTDVMTTPSDFPKKL
jgi:hypothetical protein